MLCYPQRTAGDVRAMLGTDKIVGVSVQTVEQAVLAQERGAFWQRYLRYCGDQRYLLEGRYRGGSEGA